MSIDLVAAADRLVHARLNDVLMAAVENGDLKVIERIAGDVRQRIKIEQRRRLRTYRHLIVWGRLPVAGSMMVAGWPGAPCRLPARSSSVGTSADSVRAVWLRVH